MVLQTEFSFALPRGFVDETGEVHREGIMRLATAGDEIRPMSDPRVKANPQYAMVIVLSRVITRLGSVEDVNPRIIEGLFIEDAAFLQEFYNRINNGGELSLKSECPNCKQSVEVSLSPGEALATPSNGSTRR